MQAEIIIFPSPTAPGIPLNHTIYLAPAPRRPLRRRAGVPPYAHCAVPQRGLRGLHIPLAIELASLLSGAALLVMAFVGLQ